MIKLSNVDLIIIDCLNINKALSVLCHCSEMIEFGSSKIFSHIKPFDIPEHIEFIKIDQLDSIEKYSDFCLKLNLFISNDYVLLIQTDGFILNPELWNDKFLDYDYIGSPFPNFGDLPNDIGNGGFSLRSKKFLNYATTFETTNGQAEDMFLTVDHYKDALDYGINFPDLQIALKFASSYDLPQYKINHYQQNEHFGFHNRRLFNQLKKQRPDLELFLDYLQK